MSHARCLVLIAVLWVAPTGAWAQSADGDSVGYRLSGVSRLTVTTGKAGLLGFAGHKHTIRARAFSGRIVYYPSRAAASHVEIAIVTDSLEVLTPPDTEEIRKVTEWMLTQVLDVEHFHEIMFASRTVTPTDDGFLVLGELAIRGRTRDVPVNLKVEIGADTLRAAATFAVKQTDFGITPYRGGPAGTVRVADRLTFDIQAVAVREEPP